MNICENKLSTHNIPKKYLINRKFSYKLYINLCYIAFWNYGIRDDGTENKFVEYKLHKYSLKDISCLTGLSVNTIKDRFKKLPYRDKFELEHLDNNGELMENFKFRRQKHIMFNSPKSNYLKINLDTIGKLITLDEFDIRLYILVYGYIYNEIRGLTQQTILEMIGYSSKSHNNFSKLTQSTSKLKELKLLDYKVESDGIKKYIIYYKI